MNWHRGREPDHERGATAVEYGLLVALIAGVIIVAVTFLGQNIIPLYSVQF
jgi:pilus assembly protein Flp/PilA